MIGQTHGMLKRLRDAGYEVVKQRDTAGNWVWHINELHYTHDPATGRNTPQREYRGKIAPLNPRPMFRGTINPGTPRYFYAHVTPTNQSSTSPRGMQARQIANDYLAGSTMEELA